jgi:hypothetical protein
MAYGEPFVANLEAEIDYNGIIILDLPYVVFKTLIFPKMCEGMDNATLLNFLMVRDLSLSVEKKCHVLMWFVVFSKSIKLMLQHLISPMGRT